jgi:hypothetical protein
MHHRQEKQGVPPEVASAWLHHRFTQIHPFADGNGRVARAIASVVFIKANWFPLIIARDDRTRYIEALEKADLENLRPLIGLFVETQRNALIQASEIAYDVTPAASVDAAIGAILDRLATRGRLATKERLVAKSTAQELVSFTHRRFDQIRRKLYNEIGASSEFGFEVHTGKGIDATRHHAIALVGHTASFEDFDYVVRLHLNADRSATLAISFHTLGQKFRGIIGAVGYYAVADSEPVVVGGGGFQVNYVEEPYQAKARFSTWLEQAIVEGLNEWRRSL